MAFDEDKSRFDRVGCALYGVTMVMLTIIVFCVLIFITLMYK